MSAKEEMKKLEEAKAAEDTQVLDKLSRSDFVTVRKEAQKALNEIDGIVDEKGDNVSTPLSKDTREEQAAAPAKDDSGWISATAEEAKAYEAKGRLKGYNPSTGKALLN